MKVKSILLAVFLLAAVMLTPCAQAEKANITIAVQGRDGFDDYIETMFVWDGRLLMSSWDKMYVWEPDGNQLIEVEGYDELRTAFDKAITHNEDGASTFEMGDVEIELDEEQYLYLDSGIFVLGDKLYRCANLSDYENGSETYLFELLIDDEGVPSFGECIELDDALTIEYSDGYYGTRSLETPCFYDGVLYAMSYGEMGREFVALDVEDADLDILELDIEGEIQSMSPFTEGKLLLIEVNYNVEPMTSSLLAYDIEAEEVTVLGELPRIGYESPAALAFDAEKNQLIYVLSGSVWRMPVTEAGLGTPEEFSDMPLDIYSDSAAVLMDRYYIVSSYEGVVARNIDVEKMPAQRMRVANMSYSQEIKDAYYPFTDAHPEYMVSISDSSAGSDILKDMMNRSGDVDIYTMNVASEGYMALLERGYMAELGGSDVLRGAVDGMYDYLKEIAAKDGEIYAVPLDTSNYGLTINTTLLTEKLGYTEEDLPKTWIDLYELLADIAESGKIEEFPEVDIMEPGYIVEDAKYQMFSYMLESYFLWMQSDEDSLMRGGEVLLANCAAFEKIDWSAFGLPESYDEDEMNWMYEPENILLSTGSVHPRYYYEETQIPLVLAMEEGGEPLMGFDVNVMFVNPFSANREAAIEYLEYAWAAIDPTKRIAMMPGENDPIESPYFEENLESFDTSIADFEEQLADEELDEEMRDMLTENLKMMKEYREEYLVDGRWDVSEKDIARYRKYAQYGVASQATIWGSGTYKQMQQYLDGAISAQQMVAELEKTLQMQRLEGN